MPGVEVRLEGITKRYGKTVALDNVTLRVEKSRITTLLGPSGCGKTTLLRVIAGLEKPDTGRVFFDGEDVTGLPPEKREIGFVFQDLALFPHMSVFENVAFGLRVRGVGDAEIRRRVEEALWLVGLEPSVYAGRRINELSGGQRQRVAIARALVIEPRVLLLDEPFAHLDYKIKQRLLVELRRIQRETGATIVYVTHDQNEAMEVSDMIAIMKEGRVVQTGSPDDVYENPASLFVASFYGEANVMGVEDGRYVVVRPEKLVINPRTSVDHVVEGVVEDVIFQGPLVRLHVRVDGRSVRVLKPRVNGRNPRPGERVLVGWRSSDARVVPP